LVDVEKKSDEAMTHLNESQNQIKIEYFIPLWEIRTE